MNDPELIDEARRWLRFAKEDLNVAQRLPIEFDFLHSNPESLPMRCRFKCPKRLPWEMTFGSLGQRLPLFAGMDDSLPEPYSWVNLEPREGGWPEWLWTRDEQILSADEARELFPGSMAETVLPRRILLVGRNLNAEDVVDDIERTAR